MIGSRISIEALDANGQRSVRGRDIKGLGTKGQGSMYNLRRRIKGIKDRALESVIRNLYWSYI